MRFCTFFSPVASGKAIPFLFTVLLIGNWAAAQTSKRQQVEITSLTGLYLGIPDELKDLHFEDSLVKSFGKAKAVEVLRGLESNNWPKSIINSYVDTDYGERDKWVASLRTWKIFSFQQKACILEAKPEDNQMYRNPDYTQPFYLLYVDLSSIATRPWKSKSVAPLIAKNASDEEIRKNFISEYRKKWESPERKVRTAILKTTVTGGQSTTLPTAFEANQQRTLLVLTNGDNNKVAIYYKDSEDGETVREPEWQETQNGYTLSRFSFYSDSKNVELGLKENKTADFTLLLLTQKNDKGLADYRKKKADNAVAEKRQVEDDRRRNAAKYSDEYTTARAGIVKILNKVDLFIRQTEWTLDYINSHGERDGWTWDQYGKYYKKVKEAYSDVISTYNNNKASISVSNPEFEKINKWFQNISTQNQDIQAEINRLDEVNNNSKTPSLISFRMTYGNLIRFAKKIVEQPF